MIPVRLRRLLLRTYGRLPPTLRRGLVRVASPTFLVGAACVIEHDGRLLAVRHSYYKHWGLSGGGMSRGEMPEACAVREAAEEVGLAIEPVGKPTVVVDASHKRVDLVYRCRLAAGADPAAARPCSAEIVEVRWVPIAELAGIRWSRSAAVALRSAGYLIRR